MNFISTLSCLVMKDNTPEQGSYPGIFISLTLFEQFVSILKAKWSFIFVHQHLISHRHHTIYHIFR
jgi:hypothetical protein